MNEHLIRSKMHHITEVKWAANALAFCMQLHDLKNVSAANLHINSPVSTAE